MLQLPTWAGRRCALRSATSAVIGGYPRPRTRRIVPLRSVVQCFGTKEALMVGHDKHESRRVAATKQRLRSTDDVIRCPATTLRGLLPNVSALAMTSLLLAPKRTLKRRSSSSLQERRPQCSRWNWVVAMDGFLSGFFPECAWRSESTRRRPASAWHWNIWDANHRYALPAWTPVKWAFATAPLI